MAYSYLRHSIPYLDQVTLQSLRDVVPTKALEIIQTNTVARLENSSGSGANPWRRQVKLSVEEIIFPGPITWMDDDGSIPDDQYIKRVFDDIRNRFTKWCCSS